MLRIGSLSLRWPTVLAPMAGLTDAVFRRLVDELGGCGLLVSELVAAEGLRRRNRRTLAMIVPLPTATPQFLQLFGADPQAMAEAARLVCGETPFAGVDLNMGCPAQKVVRGGGGSALLREPAQVAAVVRAVRRACPRPLTVKVRLGYDRVNVREVLAVIAAEGADGAAVHFRLRGESYARPARWEFAAGLRDGLGIPLIGNGDIRDAATAAQRLREVDGVMIGRGACADPFLFRRISGGGVAPGEGRAMLGRLCDLVESHFRTERERLVKLKAYTRLLDLHRPAPRSLKKPVFLSLTFADARRHFLELLGP